MVKKADYIMSPAELQSLNEEMRENKQMLRAVEDDGYGAGTRAESLIDKSALKASISKCDALVKKYSPLAVKGKAKDNLAKRSKELAEFIATGMPTRSDMNKTETSWRNLKWEHEKASAIQEWKQCQRRLEPGDPSASNVERLRRVR